MKSVQYFMALFLIHTLFAVAYGATINSPTCERADVEVAINAARDGDTVRIPAGRCTWTKTVTVGDPTTHTATKAIVLQGAGIGQTIIVDGTDKEDSNRESANFLSNVLAIITKPGALTRLTGITFDGGTGPGDSHNKGMVLIKGDSKTWRIDNCHFLATRTSALHVYVSGGVIDHNIFDVLHIDPGGLSVLLYGHNGEDDYGDRSWADTTDLGTDKAFFIEDNFFRSPPSPNAVSVAHDGWTGERVIFRYNKLVETWFANHGTESSGRLRGARTFEVYENTIDITGDYPAAIAMRSGVGVVFNNRVTGPITNVASLHVFRVDENYWPFGQCNGRSPWDGNRQPNGYPCLDQPGFGKSDLITGDDPMPVRWPNQLAEPTYTWNNTLNGQPGRMVSDTPSHIVEGRDFFNSPKPGYTPYPYPHPLVTGVSSTLVPPPPQRLRVLGQ